MNNEALVAPGGALTVVGNNPLAMLNQGGLGLEAMSRLFQVKPATLEIVQKTSKQDNVQPGKFRDTSTNTHFDEIQVVLLAMPIEQRQLFKKGNDFSKEAKLCFSLDNTAPHARAKEPQAPFCASCPKGEIGWAKWRETKSSDDVPPCRKYWHLFLADRQTQMPYYFNVKGTGVNQFEFDMQKLARILLQLEANAKATPENRQIAADNRVIMESNAKILDQSQWAPLKQFVGMPNIFDITFTIGVTTNKDKSAYIPICKDFKVLNEQGKKEFGELYLDFLQRKNAGLVQDQLTSEAEAENQAATAPAAPPKSIEVAAVVGTPEPLNVQGEVVGAKAPITI